MFQFHLPQQTRKNTAADRCMMWAKIAVAWCFFWTKCIHTKRAGTSDWSREEVVIQYIQSRPAASTETEGQKSLRLFLSLHIHEWITMEGRNVTTHEQDGDVVIAPCLSTWFRINWFNCKSRIVKRNCVTRPSRMDGKPCPHGHQLQLSREIRCRLIYFYTVRMQMYRTRWKHVRFQTRKTTAATGLCEGRRSTEWLSSSLTQPYVKWKERRLVHKDGQ